MKQIEVNVPPKQPVDHDYKKITDSDFTYKSSNTHDAGADEFRKRQLKRLKQRQGIGGFRDKPEPQSGGDGVLQFHGAIARRSDA